MSAFRCFLNSYGQPCQAALRAAVRSRDQERRWTRTVALLALAAALVAAMPRVAGAAAAERGAGERANTNGVLSAGLEFIDTSFENASPLWCELAADGTIAVHLLYDHERASPNRAAGHIHFLIQATPGAKLTFEFKNLDNIWNGRPGSVGRELKTVVVSENGRDWKASADGESAY